MIDKRTKISAITSNIHHSLTPQNRLVLPGFPSFSPGPCKSSTLLLVLCSLCMLRPVLLSWCIIDPLGRTVLAIGPSLLGLLVLDGWPSCPTAAVGTVGSALTAAETSINCSRSPGCSSPRFSSICRVYGGGAETITSWLGMERRYSPSTGTWFLCSCCNERGLVK